MVGELGEKEFVSNKVKLWNEKESGKGEEFSKLWYGSQTKSYPAFFRKKMEEFTAIKKSDSSKYTLILKTKQLETGWSGGLVGGVAIFVGEAAFVETEKPEKILARIILSEAPGKESTGGDFDMMSRIRSAYGMAAQLISIQIKKAWKRKKTAP